MLAVFLATVTWLPPIWGLGDFVAGRLRARPLGLATTGVLGLAALAAVGTVVHLVAPLTPIVAAGTFGVGLWLFLRSARRLTADVPRATWAGMALVAAGIAAASDLPARHYDMGLYWLQAVRWTTESAQPLGIATLHARLGFNSTWFTVCALLEHPLAAGKSALVAPALVVLLGAWLAAEGIRDVLARRGGLSGWLALSTALVVGACAQQLGGHSPDAAAAVLGFAALVAWARAFEPGEADARHAAVATVLAALATTVKLSAAILLAATPLLLVLLARRGAARRALATPAAAAAALLVPWVLKGYLASGCPLFPSSIACLPLPWATPASIGEEVSGWIRSWARAPGVRPEIVLASWDWLPGWAGQTWRDPAVRTLTWTLAAGASGMVAVRRTASPGFWPLLAVAVTGGAFWFVGAPTPRFGWAYLFAIALLPAAEVATRVARGPRRWPVVAVAAAGLAAAGVITAASLDWIGRVPPRAFSPVAWPRIPGDASRETVTLPGLRVRIPIHGDQCWSAPLPCTPYFDPGLSFDGRAFRTVTVNPRHP